MAVAIWLVGVVVLRVKAFEGDGGGGGGEGGTNLRSSLSPLCPLLCGLVCAGELN